MGIINPYFLVLLVRPIALLMITQLLWIGRIKHLLGYRLFAGLMLLLESAWGGITLIWLSYHKDFIPVNWAPDESLWWHILLEWLVKLAVFSFVTWAMYAVRRKMTRNDQVG